MKKSELIRKIKSLVKNSIIEKPELPKGGSDLPISRFDLINQFPKLASVLSDLMTNDFDKFLKNVLYVAPKPTTFKIILINNQYFFLCYGQRSWESQIEGKKYYLGEKKDMQMASEAISRLLRFGKTNNEKGENSLKNEVPEEKSKEKESPEEEK